jgi:hypothetical protein
MIASVLEAPDLDRLSLSRTASLEDREDARFVLRPPMLGQICPSASSVRILFEPPINWKPINPSVCFHRGELWCVVRTINCTFSGRKYTVLDPKGVYRSENYLGRLLPSGEFIGARHMRDLNPLPTVQKTHAGYEDVRLVSLEGELTGSATVRVKGSSCRIVRLRLNAEGDVEQANVQPSNQVHEKNWMPLSVDGRFTWIYSLDPTAILPGPLRKPTLALDHLRGGAAIGFGDGYLCVTHEAIDLPHRRIYLHRFVRLDARFNVTAVSQSWAFAHHGIEFCTGLAEQDGTLFLTYGIEECEAWFVRVPAREIENMEWIHG